MGIPDFQAWLFKHDVVEVCTAVKGPFLHQTLSGGADAVVYLDPDTALFTSLAPLEEMLRADDILLTPHLLDANDELEAILLTCILGLQDWHLQPGLRDGEGGRGRGARFGQWWSDRLLSFCYDDIPNGLFVDQRWCDHVPLVDKVKVVRDPGYNVASWNLSKRLVAVGQDGAITVNGHPLRFWHFTKLGPTGDAMTKRYAGDNHAVYEIWRWYKEEVAKTTDPVIPERYWAYEAFSDGTKIAKARLGALPHPPGPAGRLPRPLRGRRLSGRLANEGLAG